MKRRKLEETENNEKKQPKQKRNSNPQIALLTYVFLGLFLVMIGYIAYFVQVEGKKAINNPYNKRQELLAKKITRGSIFSAEGEVLAETVTDDMGKESRYYPYGRMFCHVVGRVSNSYTGIELSQCFPMLTSSTNGLEQIFHEIVGEKSDGDNVVTTLNYELQKIAYESLGNHKGAVVAMEPSTGKILAMVSKPDYDPNTVAEEWEELLGNEEEDSALVNRATQGLYPPGSTFKILTALEYLQENGNGKDYQYECKGSATYGGNTIRCYGGEVHGSLDLEKSFAESCNASFATMGTGLQINKFKELCEKFLFNKMLPLDFEHNRSSFSLTEGAKEAEVTHTSIGQGETLISPLHNAMITATIANKGVMMKPYVVDHVENVNGRIVTEYKPKKVGRIITKKEAKKMKKLMKAVVTEGTATALQTDRYEAAGKTGTAEFDSSGSSHAWFVGYAPARNPKIVVSIIVEGAGTGSAYAVPIAKKLFDAYLE